MRWHSQRGSTEVARPGSMPTAQLATSGHDHWFDGFTKRLATAPSTRRQFLELGVAGGNPSFLGKHTENAHGVGPDASGDAKVSTPAAD